VSSVSVKQWVSNGMTMDWVIPEQEEDQEEMYFVLQLEFVALVGQNQLRDGRMGVVLGEHTSIPPGIEVTSLQPEDVADFHGRKAWLKGGNGLAIKYGDHVCPIFMIEDVTPGVGGTLNFCFLPSELDPTGKGEVFWHEPMMAEAA